MSDSTYKKINLNKEIVLISGHQIYIYIARNTAHSTNHTDERTPIYIYIYRKKHSPQYQPYRRIILISLSAVPILPSIIRYFASISPVHFQYFPHCVASSTTKRQAQMPQNSQTPCFFYFVVSSISFRHAASATPIIIINS